GRIRPARGRDWLEISSRRQARAHGSSHEWATSPRFAGDWVSEEEAAMSASRGTLVLIDGVLRSAEEATVSVFDRGFLYGDSVFETVRTYGGRPFALDEHLDRLERSARRVLIPMPVPRAVLAEEIERGIRESENAESLVRV